MLKALITSKARREIILLLFDGEDIPYHPRDIERLTHLNIRGLLDQLIKLENTGLISAKYLGNKSFYKANRDSPYYEPICHLAKLSIKLGH
jgi:predicted transcriptional regulator